MADPMKVLRRELSKIPGVEFGRRTTHGELVLFQGRPAGLVARQTGDPRSLRNSVAELRRNGVPIQLYGQTPVAVVEPDPTPAEVVSVPAADPVTDRPFTPEELALLAELEAAEEPETAQGASRKPVVHVPKGEWAEVRDRVVELAAGDPVSVDDIVRLVADRGYEVVQETIRTNVIRPLVDAGRLERRGGLRGAYRATTTTTTAPAAAELRVEVKSNELFVEVPLARWVEIADQIPATMPAVFVDGPAVRLRLDTRSVLTVAAALPELVL